MNKYAKINKESTKEMNKLTWKQTKKTKTKERKNLTVVNAIPIELTTSRGKPIRQG